MKHTRICLFLLAQLLPLGAWAAPVGFSQAFEMALGRLPAASAAACPLPQEDFAALAQQLASANESDLPPATPLAAAPLPAGAIVTNTRSGLLLCTALLYNRLDSLQTRQLLRDSRQELIARLLHVESRRVSAEVDSPLELTRARQLAARARLEALSLEAALPQARHDLAALTGLPEAGLEVSAASLPALPDPLPLRAGDQLLLRQLLAYRDIVQLDYAAAHTSRLKAAHDSTLGRVSIGQLIAAHIEEQSRLLALLRLHVRIRAARLQFLASAGRMEAWAQAELPAAPESAAGQNPPLPPSAELLSLMVAPGLESLPQGKSQQFTAIATYADGKSRDVSAQARWTLSNDLRAVLSSTGLLTALSPGRLTLTASFAGQSQSLALLLEPQPPDEFLTVERAPAGR